MARWRLTDKHYLPVEGTEWEYIETDQETGRRARKIYEVPKFLDPKNPADFNYPGEIIVSHKPHGRDYIFKGDPTADMEPLDEEATEISNRLRERWREPFEELDMKYVSEQNYSQSLLRKHERLVDEAWRKEPQSLGGVSETDFKALQEQVKALMEQNLKLQRRV